MCNHDNEKESTWLERMPSGEVYMCECGALIDITQKRNHKDQGTFSPMTADELEAQFEAAECNTVKALGKAIAAAISEAIK